MLADVVADMEVDMVATTVFEQGFAQSQWMAAMYITSSKTQLQFTFRQKAICWFDRFVFHVVRYKYEADYPYNL